MLSIHPSQVVANTQMSQRNTSFNGKTTKEMRMLYIKSLKKTKIDAIINNTEISHAEKFERIKNMAESKIAGMSIFDKIKFIFKKA